MHGNTTKQRQSVHKHEHLEHLCLSSRGPCQVAKPVTDRPSLVQRAWYSAQEAGTAAGVCTHRACWLLCRVTVNDLLVQAGLGHFFQAYVTAEDGMDTISQRFLSASIKLGRPPNQCVVFESSPAGITAAHNCTMKVSCLAYAQ